MRGNVTEESAAYRLSEDEPLGPSDEELEAIEQESEAEAS
jgi:hypothetical protein